MNRINRIRQNLFSVRYLYSNPLDAQRAQVLTVLTVLIGVMLVITFAFFQIPEIFRSGQIDLFSVAITLIDLVALSIAYRLIQTGKLHPAIWVVVGLVVLAQCKAYYVAGRVVQQRLATAQSSCCRYR
jgi:hypothetical protein